MTKPRHPSKKAKVVATSGAVIIYTEEGNVVITPKLAAVIAEQLPEMAELAASAAKEDEEKNSRPFPEMPWREGFVQ